MIAYGSSSILRNKRSSQDVAWKECTVKLTPHGIAVAPFTSYIPGRTSNPETLSIGTI